MMLMMMSNCCYSSSSSSAMDYSSNGIDSSGGGGGGGKSSSSPVVTGSLSLLLLFGLLLSSCEAASSSSSSSSSWATTRKSFGSMLTRKPSKSSPFPSIWNHHHRHSKTTLLAVKSLTVRGGATTTTASRTTTTTTSAIKIWPCMDELDKRLIKISIPMMINFSITPLVGANDLFWTNRMKNPLALAGMSASNQVYNIGFWLASFLPSITSTLVSKENAQNNQQGIQDAVSMSMIIATLIGIIGSSLFVLYPKQTLLSILKDPNHPAMEEYAMPYLFIRSFAFLPGLISLVGFSAFRGTLDVQTPFKISFCSNLINCILDPILIFGCNMGVTGNALSTLLSEIVSSITFLILLQKKNLMKFCKLLQFPSLHMLLPLIKGGIALQLRMIGLNVTFMAVSCITQQLDTTGIAISAHEMTLQTFQLGGVLLIAMSVVAQIIIANDINSKTTDSAGGSSAIQVARSTSNRLLSWGLLLGGGLGIIQLVSLPILHKILSPMQTVRDASLSPSVVACVLQIINGIVFIGEGIMSGCNDFMFLAISTICAMVGCLAALYSNLPKHYGVTGVWLCFGVFNTIRLIGVYIHQFHYSQIAPSKMKK